MRSKKRNIYSVISTGLGLLELVMALTILSILLTYAIPSYQNHIRHAHRLAVCMALYQAVQYIEQQWIDASFSSQAFIPSLPPQFSQSPPHTQAVYQLQVKIQNHTPDTYTIQADPIESGPMGQDFCGRYELNARGQRSNWLNGQPQSDATVTQCWQGK